MRKLLMAAFAVVLSLLVSAPPSYAATSAQKAEALAKVREEKLLRCRGEAPPQEKTWFYNHTYFGASACDECVDMGLEGLGGGAWRDYYCWMTAPGPWYSIDLWVSHH
jgi:hypothetical protein